MNANKFKRNLLGAGCVFLVLLLLLPTALKKYIATPHAASQLSRVLSKTLGQPVAIGSMDISGGVLRCKGVSLADPEGFPASKLLSIDSLTVAPVWLELLSDRKSFDRLVIEGIRVDLHRNQAGIWNFNALQRRFSSPKPSAVEFFIHDLKVLNGTVQVNEQKLDGITLHALNLATKGSEKSGFKLEFDDSAHNRYVISGNAHLGQDPELDVTVASSSISLGNLSKLLQIKSGFLPERGSADLQVSAALRKGRIKGAGTLRFNTVKIPAAGAANGFSGALALAVDYDLQKDYLVLENASLHLNGLLAVKASGEVREVKWGRYFTLEAETDDIDIRSVAEMIPELKRRKIVLGGVVQKSTLRLSGNAGGGITAASGKSGLSHGVLQQEGQPVFNDLDVVVALSSAGGSVTANGKATQAQSQAKPVIEVLDVPFKLAFNKQLHTFSFESPALAVQARGVAFTGRVSYADGIGLLENARVKSGDATVVLDRFSARIPQKQVSAATVRYPVHARFSGCDLRWRDAVVKKTSGTFSGAYVFDPNGKWLEGTADLTAEKASWQNKEADAPHLWALFEKQASRVDLKTSLRGGSVEAHAAFNPFALHEKVDFTVHATGLQLEGIMQYAGIQGNTELSGGALDIGCTGSYSRSEGISCAITANGKNISATGAGGKTVISAAGINFDGDFSGRTLVIKRAVLSVGDDIAVTAAGAFENVLQPNRRGRIDFTLPNVSLALVADSFLNVLPRSIQEATVTGDVAATGAVSLQEGKAAADGVVTLAHMGIDVPTQRIKISDINGTLPFSLDFGRGGSARLPAGSTFNRQNYPVLLKQLRLTGQEGETITMGKASFGDLGIDSAKIQIKAAGGVTEITRLDSSLFGGAILGRGFLTAQNGILYRGDMLLNGLSLQQLCKAFPAITGYISGKVDGIVSVQGSGRGLSDLSGFTELWARAASDEKMLVSKEFLQRLSGKKLSGFFFSSDRAYDHAGIKASLEKGYLTFNALDISHTNFLGIRDLSVSIAPGQNRIAIDHLLNSIKNATERGKSAIGSQESDAPAAAPPATEFKWDE